VATYWLLEIHDYAQAEVSFTSALPAGIGEDTITVNRHRCFSPEFGKATVP
jgi:hypothetical protein